MTHLVIVGTGSAGCVFAVIAQNTDKAAFIQRERFIGNTDMKGLPEMTRISGTDAFRNNGAELPTAARTFMGLPFIAGSCAGIAACLDPVAEKGLTGKVLAGLEQVLVRFIQTVMPVMRSRTEVPA